MLSKQYVLNSGVRLLEFTVCLETTKILCGQLNGKLSTKSLSCFCTATATATEKDSVHLRYGCYCHHIIVITNFFHCSQRSTG